MIKFWDKFYKLIYLFLSYAESGLLLQQLPQQEVPTPRGPCVVNRIRISELRQLIAQMGIACEVNNGTLTCTCSNGVVYIQKVSLKDYKITWNWSLTIIFRKFCRTRKHVPSTSNVTVFQRNITRYEAYYMTSWQWYNNWNYFILETNLINSRPTDYRQKICMFFKPTRYYIIIQ